MEIKVKKAMGSADETSSTLQLTKGLKVPEAVKEQIKNDVGNYLIEQILLSASASKSPIEGESWKKSLSPEYKKKKKAEGLDAVANLEEEGDLLDSLEFDTTNDGITIGWFGDQAGKADGHANLSGDSSLPQRRLIPDKGQEFKSDIQDGIEKIVADALVGDVELDPEDFESVGTKSELYEALGEYFSDQSRSDIRGMIARSPDLYRSLDDMDLIHLL